MTTRFITNAKGEKTAAIIPIGEYEDLLHQHHVNLELTDEYKSMIDKMLKRKVTEKPGYVSYKTLKISFNVNHKLIF
jgi:hypothetical protein